MKNELMIIEGIDMNTMRTLIAKHYRNFEEIRGKNVLPVIGLAGSGKSTLINYFLGCQMKIDENGEKLKVISELGEFAETGDGPGAQTMCPIGYLSVKDNIELLDCPGFMGTRTDIAERIFESVSTQMAFILAGSMRKIIVVIKYSDIPRPSLQLIELMKLIGQFIKDPKKISESFLFVITHAPESLLKKSCEQATDQIFEKINELRKHHEKTVENRKVALEAERGGHLKEMNWVTKRLAGLWQKAASMVYPQEDKIINESQAILKILELIRRDNLVVANFCDQGESKQVILSQLGKSSTIDLKNHFNFKNYDSMRKKFDAIIRNLAKEGEQTISKVFELPNEIKNCKKKLASFHEQKELYQQQKVLLKNNEQGNPISQEEKELYARDKQIIQGLLGKNAEEIKECNKKIEEYNDEIKELDTDEPVFYWKFDDKEKRAFLGFLGYTRFNIKYPEENPIKKIEENYSYRATLTNRKYLPSTNLFEVTYESGYYEDGDANVIVYVEKRDFNAEVIKGIKEKLVNLEDKLDLLLNEKKYYEEVDEDKEKILEEVRRAEDTYENELNKLETSTISKEKEIQALQSKISTLTKELNVTQNNLKKNELLYETVYFYAPIYQDYGEVQAFLKIYSKLDSKKNNLKNIADFKSIEIEESALSSDNNNDAKNSKVRAGGQSQQDGSDQKLLQKLLDAISINDIDEINTLLKHVNVNAGLLETNITPLHHAAVHGNAEVVALLLEVGANPALLVDGETPSQWAAANDRPDIADLIDARLKGSKKTSPERDISVEDKSKLKIYSLDKKKQKKFKIRN